MVVCGEGNNFDQKINSPFGRLSFVPLGRVKLYFLLITRGKNLATDTDDTIVFL